MPKSISTFSPGLNAGRPSHEREPMRLQINEIDGKHTSVRTARASEGVPKIAASTTACCLRCSRSRSDKPVLLTLRYLKSSPILSTIKHNNLALRKFLRLQLSQPTCAVLACFLSSGSTYAHRLAYSRSLAVRSGQ